MNKIIFTLIFFISSIASFSQSTYKKPIVTSFENAEDLYLLQPYSSFVGDLRGGYYDSTFFKKVQEIFLDKKITFVPIQEEYTLDKNKFYIAFSNFESPSIYAIKLISIFKGTGKKWNSSIRMGFSVVAYKTWCDFDHGMLMAMVENTKNPDSPQDWKTYRDIKYECFDSRMGYLLKDLKNSIESSYIKKIRYFFYNSKSYEKTLKTNTLYLVENFISEEFEKEDIEKVYPYKFKIVSLQEWKDAFIHKKEGVILFDEARSLYPYHFTQYTLRKASTGESIFYSTFKWKGTSRTPFYKLKASFFKKMLSYYK